MTNQIIDLNLDFGDKKDEVVKYVRANPDVRLRDFLALYPARALEALDPTYYALPLRRFLFTPVLLHGRGVDVTPEGGRGDKGQLHDTLDALHAEDMARTAEPATYPETLSDGEAVKVAYRHELEAVARFLEHDLSVLVVCDKILTEHIYEYVCHQAGRVPVLDDAVPEGAQTNRRDALRQAMGGGGPSIQETLPLLIAGLKENQVLVLRSVDVLDNPTLIEVLYQGEKAGRMPQLLGFLDPSQEAPKVITDRFAIRVGVMGLPRSIQPDADKPPVYTVPRLMTAKERGCFAAFDAEGLYKNVAGLNVVQFRNAMRYIGATVVPCSASRDIYDQIRQFKTSSSDEIEIPDTTFDDIGGYRPIKRELQRIVALATGRVAGLDDRERQKLVPRGFIFHGPPGTGKTLFAKAIANQMHATIQMVSGPEIMDKYVGQSESNLRHIFATARRNAPSVVFFDEFDSIAGQRSNYSDGGARANNAVVAQLLTELDGFREDQAVLVIGTTNRLDIIDEALLRPSRLKPIQIGLPDYTARRAVAAIHAAKFGVDGLICDLCRLVLDHLPGWAAGDDAPPAFLEALFALHPPYRRRYDVETQRAGFARELRDLFALLRRVQDVGDGHVSGAQTDTPLAQVEQRVLRIARRYNLDLTAEALPDLDDPEVAARFQPMAADVRDLFALVQEQRQASGRFSPETFFGGVLDLVAEYTEGFNNDEIRAIFQEASLEHHLEGQLVTPRYIGMKIGLLRQRRDERQVVHLGGARH